MSDIKRAQHTNFRIARFRNALEQSSMTTVKNCFEELFDKIEYINEQVTTTHYLENIHPDWIGNTILHFAAFYIDEQAFLFLLNKGADFTIKNNDGDTALHLAFKENIFEDDKDMQVVMNYVQNSKFKNICDKYGFSYFHIACIANNVKIVQHFLSNGVTVHQVVSSKSHFCPGYTPLHFAISNDAFEVAEVLLHHGAYIHAKDPTCMTPLHLLLEKNFNVLKSTREEEEEDDLESSGETTKQKINKILRLMLKRYTDTKMLTIDSIGLSNLHVACTLDDLTVAKRILKKVPNINGHINVDSHLWPGYTALHFAALSNLEAVKLLMMHGADMEVKDATGVTAFVLCTKKFQVEDIYAILSLNPIWKNIVLSDGQSKLLDLVWAMRTSEELNIFLKQDNRGHFLGYNAHIPYNSPIWPGFSLMHLAIALPHNTQEESIEETSIRLMRAVFERNPALLYSQDVHGWTPLHLACRLNKQNIVNLLLKLHSFYDNVPNLVDEDGLSFMHISCANNDTYFLQKLLLSNLNVNVVYRGKSVIASTILPQTTPLYVAVANNSYEMVKVLVERGADVNVKDENDMTPLHLSFVTSKDKEITMTLLSFSNSADSIVNGVGLSHLHVAAYHDDQRAMERFIANGADVNQILTTTGKFKHLSRYVGFTPLAFAIDHSSFNGAAWLMERGADIFMKIPSGISLLYETMNNCSFLSFPRVFEDVFLEKRVRTDIGLTELHFACFKRDHHSVKYLLDNGAKVNAQIHKSSLRWSEFTPLHVLMFHPVVIDEGFERIFDMLIHKGADVTLLSESDDHLETPIHMAHNIMLYSDIGTSILPHIHKMLEVQQDFSINPTNMDGITHFHIACNLCNTAIVEKFLEYEYIDVNRPIEVFAEIEDCCTPLQLAFDNDSSKATQRLQTAKLLLTHGADVNVSNMSGNTLLHQCINSNSFDFFEMLMSYGANPNARNWDKRTPLECFIIKNNLSIETLKVLLRFGCRYNTYDALTEAGYIGLTLQSTSFQDMENFIPALTANFANLIKIDDMKRTVIHNIVSIKEFEISACEYAMLIEELTVACCDIDDQDNAGRSALHLAAKFKNFPAISGLLMTGADINTVDSTGKTAFTCDFALCNRGDRNDVDNDIDDHSDEDNEDAEDCNDRCVHLKMLETFAIHIKKLQLFGLDVHMLNENLVSEACRKFPLESQLNGKFYDEIEKLKRAHIELYPLTLFDFLSENGAVADFPCMSQMKQNAIHNAFIQINTVREKFSETLGILKLQYRKAVARVGLVEKGRHSLKRLTGFRLPDTCSQLILKFLKNSELKTLILASENFCASN